MLSQKVEQLLNEQIVAEMYSANLYLSMSAWFSDKSLDGYANWFYVQYKEEMDHALIFYNYINNAGGVVKMGGIDTPPVEFADTGSILEQSLAHEELVTSLIYTINTAAQEAGDYKTIQFLDWFVKEQVEEEDKASTNLGRYKLFGADPRGLLTLDQEMAARAYTQTPELAAIENA